MRLQVLTRRPIITIPAIRPPQPCTLISTKGFSMEQTSNLTKTIAAFFQDSNNARKAVEALHDAGFTSAHIGVAHRGAFGSSSAGDVTSSTTTTRTSTGTGKHDLSTWDKVKSWFTGDEPEAYENERPRGDISGREVIDPDANSGYASSDLHGSFRNMDLPEEHSRYFSHRLGRSSQGAVVTVNAGARRDEAEDILIQYGGDLASNASSYDYDDIGTSQATGAATTTARDQYRDESPENIQLLGEVLRVHKDRVSRGEVSLRKEVVTDTQTVQVPVTREELVIERRPGSETPAPAGSIGESEIRVPLTEERANVEKSTVVREEVSVGKRPVEEVQDVSGEVRREELVVDDTTRKNDPNRKVA
jgi:uncharacterized protein (TIGR02271 family)